MSRNLVPAALLSLVALPLFADANVSIILLPNPIIHPVVNSAYDLNAAALNQGPDLAKNVRVTLTIPAGLTILGSFPSGACDTAHVPVVCTAGDVPAGKEPGFALSFMLPAEGGAITVGASVTSDTPDPHTDDNTATRTINVEDLTNLAMSNVAAPPRVDPGTTTVVTTRIDNYMPSVPHDIHVHYEASDATIEKIDAGPEWTCSHTDSSADCSAASLNAGCRCAYDLALTLRVKNDRAGGNGLLQATLTTSLPDVSGGPIARTSAVEIYRWIVVTSTADAGTGSLRDAIDQANAGCSAPCRIAFEIPAPVPSSGWFTIAPSAPLPAITADRILIDGATQTAFTGDTNRGGPEIFLDGRFTNRGHGLEIRSKCDSVVQDLAIGNFVDHGLALPVTDVCRSVALGDAHRVAANYLGVEPGGFAAAPNLRGLLVENGGVVTGNVISGNRASGVWVWRGPATIDGNLIGTAADGKTALPNGRSGIFFGPLVYFAEALRNTIAYNGEMGVAIARDAQLVDVRENSMRRNGGLPIDIGLDGRDPQRADDSKTAPNAPVLLSAVYDPARNKTVVTMTLLTKPAYSYSNSIVLTLYAGDDPDGQGEPLIPIDGSSLTTDGAAFTVTLTGDYRGKWISANATRLHFIAALPPVAESTGGNSLAGGQTMTSEMSNSVQVQ